MADLMEIIALHSDLSDDDALWLDHLRNHWGMLADLSFSDLICWVPDIDDNVFWAAAQIRPSTGPTALDDDVVGEDISYDPESLVVEAYLSREVAATSGNKLHAGIPVDVHAVPIVRGDRVIAVVEMHTNRMGVRAPGALEDAYLWVADVLRGMMARAEFPSPGDPPAPGISPTVGDGSLVLDEEGTILFASPNAVSAFRRLGFTEDLLGDNFARVTAEVARGSRAPVEVPVSRSLMGERPREVDVETATAVVRLRSQPLRNQAGERGWFLMLRDATELRRRERELVTKEATIREIHHRVKNNLQTVAALLRLQGRRTSSPEAVSALNDAQKRVAAIAVVHEILSQGYEDAVRFDDVADRLMTMVRDVATTPSKVEVRRVGSFGMVPADVATNLSLVYTEVVQNAIEHGLGSEAGHVRVEPRQTGGRLQVDVINDGTPLPEGFTLEQSRSLGLSIVTTLVADMDGNFEIVRLPEGSGTRARISIPLD